MEKSLNVVEKISDQLYVITETESVHCYLVIGSDKAMLFDIGYGYENDTGRVPGVENQQ